MVILTNKQLHEQVLNSEAYRYIADNQKTFLPAIGNLTWAGWFKNHPKVGELLKNMDKYKETANDNLIPYETYGYLMTFLLMYEKETDKILKPLIQVLQDTLRKMVYNALGVINFCLNTPTFSGHRGLCQNIDTLLYIQLPKFYSDKSAIAAMGVLLNNLIKLVDKPEKREKLLKDANSLALTEIETSLGRVIASWSPYRATYCKLVLPYFNAVQETLKSNGKSTQSNFRMDDNKILKTV